MLANGNGQKPESDHSRKLHLSVPFEIGDVILEGVADYEWARGDHERHTLRIFGGWRKNAGALGVEAFPRTNLNAGPTCDVPRTAALVTRRVAPVGGLTKHGQVRAIARL